MTDLQLAKNALAGHTLCLCRDGECLYSDKRGIAPMVGFIAEGAELTGYSAADKVVGKAAAFLFVKCGVASVYAETLSQAAKRVFEENGVQFEYGTLAEKIINRAGTDICPMERTVLNASDAEEAYLLLKAKLAQLNAK